MDIETNDGGRGGRQAEKDKERREMETGRERGETRAARVRVAGRKDEKGGD